VLVGQEMDDYGKDMQAIEALFSAGNVLAGVRVADRLVDRAVSSGHEQSVGLLRTAALGWEFAGDLGSGPIKVLAERRIG
jgi:hypothetical protein